MSLPSGPRILINDRKPSKPFTPQASSYEIERNSGLKNFTVDNIVRNSDIRIVKDLSANSFAKTYLIEKDGINLVRKIVSKSDGKKHVDVLKRQKHDLERFNFLHNGLCPNVIDSGETDIDYYYDMEYLPHHKMLSDAEDYTTTLRVFRNTLDVMQENVYSLSKPVDGERWMKTFLNEKIYPKFDNFKLQSDEFNVIIESDEFYINKQKYVGLKKLFQNLSYEKLSPQNISVVHGDLTFENILYNPDNFSVKLIDMDGSRLYDAKELDLGKMSQSVLSNYNTWKSMDGDRLMTGFEDSHFKANSSFFNSHVVVMPSNLMHFWQPILKQPVDVVTRKAYFYMSTYFIRFVPFRMQLGKEHGVFALLMATAWLNKLLE